MHVWGVVHERRKMAIIEDFFKSREESLIFNERSETDTKAIV